MEVVQYLHPYAEAVYLWRLEQKRSMVIAMCEVEYTSIAFIRTEGITISRETYGESEIISGKRNCRLGD